MIKLSSMLLALLLIPLTELKAYNRLSLWKPKSGTLTGTKKPFSFGLLLLIVTSLIFRTQCPLFRCLAFNHSSSCPYALQLVLVTELFVILCVLCLPQWLSLDSLQCKCAGFVIFSNVLVCVLSLTNIGLVQCYFLVSLLHALKWNLDLTNLYVTKSSVLLTIFFAPAKVNCMEKNLDTTLTKPRHRVHILQVPRLFVISRFHCCKIYAIQWYFCHVRFALQMPGFCNTIAIVRRNFYTFVFLVCNIQ